MDLDIGVALRVLVSCAQLLVTYSLIHVARAIQLLVCVAIQSLSVEIERGCEEGLNHTALKTERASMQSLSAEPCPLRASPTERACGSN